MLEKIEEKVEKMVKKSKMISERIDREIQYGNIPTLTLSREELEHRKKYSRFMGNC